MNIALAATSQSIDIRIVDDSGLPVTGLVAATMPTLTYSKAGANADVTVTPVDLATLATAWTSSGVKERGGGVYRLDLPNATLTTQTRVTIRGEDTDKRVVCPVIDVGMIPTAAAIASATASAIGDNEITVNSPWAAGGLLSITTGDSYLAANGTSITFSLIGRTDLVGLIPHLICKSGTTWDRAASAVVSGTETMTFADVSGAVTILMTSGPGGGPARGLYQIRFLDGSGNKVTEIEGPLDVHAGLVA